MLDCTGLVMLGWWLICCQKVVTTLLKVTFFQKLYFFALGSFGKPGNRVMTSTGRTTGLKLWSRSALHLDSNCGSLTILGPRIAYINR